MQVVLRFYFYLRSHIYVFFYNVIFYFILFRFWSVRCEIVSITNILLLIFVLWWCFLGDFYPALSSHPFFAILGVWIVLLVMLLGFCCKLSVEKYVKVNLISKILGVHSNNAMLNIYIPLVVIISLVVWMKDFWLWEYLTGVCHKVLDGYLPFSYSSISTPRKSRMF